MSFTIKRRKICTADGGMVKNMKFGEILKELLEQHNLSQKQLAESLNMSPSALSNYIQGIREPDYNTLILIANYFDVTTDFLLNHPHELNFSHSEELLIHIFRSLTDDQKEFYLEQGKIFIRQNRKKESSLFPDTLDKTKDIS